MIIFNLIKVKIMNLGLKFLKIGLLNLVIEIWDFEEQHYFIIIFFNLTIR